MWTRAVYLWYVHVHVAPPQRAPPLGSCRGATSRSNSGSCFRPSCFQNRYLDKASSQNKKNLKIIFPSFAPTSFLIKTFEDSKDSTKFNRISQTVGPSYWPWRSAASFPSPRCRFAQQAGTIWSLSTFYAIYIYVCVWIYIYIYRQRMCNVLSYQMPKWQTLFFLCS